MKMTIAGIDFPTKEAAADKCRGLLIKYEPGEEITGDDKDFLLGVLARHPKAAAKMAGGVVALYTVKQPYSKCFFVKRGDGTEEDFSFHKCLGTR